MTYLSGMIPTESTPFHKWLLFTNPGIDKVAKWVNEANILQAPVEGIEVIFKADKIVLSLLYLHSW